VIIDIASPKLVINIIAHIAIIFIITVNWT